MFETTTILVATLAADRLGRWGRIIAVSAILLWPWLTPMAYADVAVSDIVNTLKGGSVPLPEDIDPNYSQDSENVAVKHVLQQLMRRPDGSFDTHYATKLGFDPPPADIEAAVQQASLSSPIAVIRIGLRRLKQFNPGHDDPLMLLAADVNWLVNGTSSFPISEPFPARLLFAITVTNSATGQEEVKSSVRLQVNLPPANPPSSQLGFEIERFGSGTLIRKIDKWRRDPTPAKKINPAYFLVWVPALDRYYLGKMITDIHDKHLLILKAITDDLQVDFVKEGKEYNAEMIFIKLKIEALTIDADDSDAPPR